MGQVIISLLFFFAIPTFAQTSASIFATPAQQQQFQNLTEQLRCLVCQNESLWDSQAPLAKDLRAEIYQKIMAGESEQAIKEYLVARYGEFILFKPHLNTTTYVLWLTPFILLLGGFIVIGWIIARNRRD